MEKKKIKTPYDHIKEEFEAFARKVVFCQNTPLGLYVSNDGLANANLTEIFQRTIAAKALGFEVVLIPREEGLFFEYRLKRPDEMPWRVR